MLGPPVPGRLECRDVALTQGWLVLGSNGENLIRAVGATQAEAWRLASEQAAAVGMLAPPPVPMRLTP
jgi:hypothetical protein